LPRPAEDVERAGTQGLASVAVCKRVHARGDEARRAAQRARRQRRQKAARDVRAARRHRQRARQPSGHSALDTRGR